MQLQEILRERICNQQLPVRPEGLEAQHKWDIILFMTIISREIKCETFKRINQPLLLLTGRLISLLLHI